jgi:dTDP-4-dehydrorhamnose reductase
MTAKRTLLITGGSGYLGRHLTVRATEAFQVYTTYRTHPRQIKAGQPLPLNLTQRDDVLRLMTTLSPQAIIHTAAVNPGRGSEAEMMQVNVAGARYIAEAAVAVGARLVHLSSDVVHSGRHAPYDDATPPTPCNEYACSKAAAEAAVTAVDATAAIVRTSLIYGLDEIDHSTAGFVARLQAGQPLVLFSDVVRQPIWVESLAAALLKLVALPWAGTLNVAGRQALTRAAFGRRMLAWWSIDTRGLLQTGRAADIADTIPLDLRLTVTRAEQLLHMTFPGVDEVLAQAAARECTGGRRAALEQS